MWLLDRLKLVLAILFPVLNKSRCIHLRSCTVPSCKYRILGSALSDSVASDTLHFLDMGPAVQWSRFTFFARLFWVSPVVREISPSPHIPDAPSVAWISRFLLILHRCSDTRVVVYLWSALDIIIHETSHLSYYIFRSVTW